MSTADEREIRRKLKVLRHAKQSGNRPSGNNSAQKLSTFGTSIEHNACV